MGILSNWILGPVGRQGLIGFPGQNIQGPKGIFMFILLLKLFNSNQNDYLLLILFTLRLCFCIGASGIPGRPGVIGFTGDRGEPGLTGDKGLPGIGFNITGRASHIVIMITLI